MKTRLSKTPALLILLLTLTLFISCSTERDPGTLPNVHPSSWSDTESADFHGKAATLNGVIACRICHGQDLDGGKVEISCIDCHASTGICSRCHGGLNDDSGAPPYGLEGERDSTALAVGAHTRHLINPKMSAPVACQTCHLVPVMMLDSAHLDYGQGGLDSIAELHFGVPVDSDTAKWDRTAGTCSNIYCHGQFEGGKKDNAPVWNQSGQAVCGSCHDVEDNPDQLGWKHDEHVRLFGLLCVDCHQTVVDSALNIVGPEWHVNAVADTSILNQALCDDCHAGGGASCSLCHGGKDNNSGAPPYSLSGDSLRTVRAVGAHTVHLSGDRLSTGVMCEDCHIVPTGVGDPGHYDTLYSAELTFSALANPATIWDTLASSCENSYCHGNFAGGYPANTPIWTGDSSQAVCGSCHDVGANPADLSYEHLIHTTDFQLPCWSCHNSVVDINSEIKEKSLHINGVVDTESGAQHVCDGCHTPSVAICTQCHGGLNGLSGLNASAPPHGLEGETSTGDLAVGAHTLHLNGNWASNGFDCSECHTVPSIVSDSGHYAVDSVAELNFGLLADPSAQYDFGNGQCDNVYCHGNFTNGYNFSPRWNTSGQAACGSCHGIEATADDLSGRHGKHVIDKNKFCSDCHGSVVSAGIDPAIIGKAVHVNGSIEIEFDNGQGTWDPVLKTCFNNGAGCHGDLYSW
ncbi:MAG: CxxxxCH/CxxCH domain-containing protein [bacterium]|nr:CxxxxCH/CxxCH domain-containing protein [bacterium]